MEENVGEVKVLHHETGSHRLVTEHCWICAKVPKHKRTHTHAERKQSRHVLNMSSPHWN